MLLLMATYLRVMRSAGSLDSNMPHEGSGDARARLCMLDEGESAVGMGVSMVLWSGTCVMDTLGCFWEHRRFWEHNAFVLVIQKVAAVSCVFSIGAVRGRVAGGSGLGVAHFDGDQRGQVREGCFRDRATMGRSGGQEGADSSSIVRSR